VLETIVFKVTMQTYRALHADAPLYLRQSQAPLTSRLNKDFAGNDRLQGYHADLPGAAR